MDIYILMQLCNAFENFLKQYTLYSTISIIIYMHVVRVLYIHMTIIITTVVRMYVYRISSTIYWEIFNLKV